jgi:hypothetical protein
MHLARRVRFRPFAGIHQSKRAARKEVRCREALKIHNPPVGLGRFDTKDTHGARCVRFGGLAPISTHSKWIGRRRRGRTFNLRQVLTPTLFPLSYSPSRQPSRSSGSSTAGFAKVDNPRPATPWSPVGSRKNPSHTGYSPACLQLANIIRVPYGCKTPERGLKTRGSLIPLVVIACGTLAVRDALTSPRRQPNATQHRSSPVARG